PLGFAACQSKKCTNQAISGIYRSFIGAAETAAPPDSGRYFKILIDRIVICQSLTFCNVVHYTQTDRYDR
ncbi:MAG: hypothetical protein MRZ33_01540, partial [Prevotella sp.]|nr:hypothetical protein [Prevotella sp.]